MFCERCTELTRRLTFDPLAEPRAELFTGSCIWSDEFCFDWCSDCNGKARQLFNLRYRITVGESLPPEAVAYFLQFETQYPEWPLFRPERRSHEIAKKVERMVSHNLRRTCIELEKWNRENQDRHDPEHTTDDQAFS